MDYHLIFKGDANTGESTRQQYSATVTLIYQILVQSRRPLKIMSISSNLSEIISISTSEVVDGLMQKAKSSPKMFSNSGCNFKILNSTIRAYIKGIFSRELFKILKFLDVYIPQKAF